MSMVQGDPVGEFECVCCNCGTQEFTLQTELYMRCPSCGCNQNRLDLRLKIRVYAFGKMNVKAMEAMLDLAKALGVDESGALTQDAGGHYVEVPAEGIHTKLEIAKITGSPGATKRSR